MERKLLIIAFFQASLSIAGQVYDKTYDEKVPKVAGKDFGELVLELPFGAKLYKNNFVKAVDFIDNIKIQCRGKAVFFDFWDTWCEPSIEGLSNSKRMSIETKDLPVEFIYICTDNRTPMDKWISKVSALKQPGIHIYVTDDFLREIWKSAPSGGGFPTYLLMDASGKFRLGEIPLNSSTTTEKLSGLINSK